MRLCFTLAAASLLSLTACNTAPEDLYLETEIPHAQLGTNVAPLGYDLELIIDPKADTMGGASVIEVQIEKPTTRIWLHGQNMTVDNVTASQNGKTIPGTFTEIDPKEAPSGVARIDFDTPLRAGTATLTIPFTTPYNLQLNSAYVAKSGEDRYIVTQMEPIGARQAFPSFDEPRFKVPFNVTIKSPSENVVYFNTPEIAQKEDGAGWVTYQFEETRPLPTYLIAFGAGPWDVVDYGDIPPNDVRKRPIALRGFAAKGKGGQMDYALRNTPGLLGALEGYFGTEYPYEKLDLIAAPEYAFGAMENPGAIVYLEYLLLLDDNAPLSQKRAYARVHSHELAHQWFGNLVTPEWWEDIWLNEAFATWMGNKGTDLWRPEANFDRLTLNAALGAMSTDSLASTRQIQEPLLRSENVMDQFDSITYRKGGGVLSMFESYVGEETFRKGVRLHMDRFKDGVADSEDFFQSIADAAENPDVVPAMKSFITQPGLPLVSGSISCGSEANGQTKLALKQSRYAPLGSEVSQMTRWQIPVCAQFIYDDGAPVKACTLLTEETGVLDAPRQGCAVAVLPNENGAGYYRFSLDQEGWLGLLKHSDQLSTREVLVALDSLEAGYRAGEVDSETFLMGMKIFAAHPEYDVASQAGDMLGFFEAYLPESARPALAKLTRDMYQSRYRNNLGKDNNDGNLLVPTLASRLIGPGGDKALQAQLAGQGAVYLGLDGPADKTIIGQNLLSQALEATMILRGKDALPVLLDMAKTGNTVEKGAAISALTATRDAEIAAQLRDMALNDEAQFNGRQATSIISGLMGNDLHKETTWLWVQNNFDDFVARRVADVRKPGMPALGRVFCDAQRRDEVKAFFESKADIIPGSSRSLAQTLESITLCAALREAKIEEMSNALNAQ